MFYVSYELGTSAIHQSRDLASKIQLLIAPPASGVRTVPSPSIHSVNSETVFPNNVLTECTRIRQGNLFLVTLECTDREQYGVTPNRFDALERSSQVMYTDISFRYTMVYCIGLCIVDSCC